MNKVKRKRIVWILLLALLFSTLGCELSWKLDNLLHTPIKPTATVNWHPTIVWENQPTADLGPVLTLISQ